MAVPRKAMTEGIRTFIFPGSLSSRAFAIPQSKIKDFCQLPLHKGASGCSRTSAFPQSIHFLPRFDNPSVSCADSSLYTREPLGVPLGQQGGVFSARVL